MRIIFVSLPLGSQNSSTKSGKRSPSAFRMQMPIEIGGLHAINRINSLRWAFRYTANATKSALLFVTQLHPFMAQFVNILIAVFWTTWRLTHFILFFQSSLGHSSWSVSEKELHCHWSFSKKKDPLFASRKPPNPIEKRHPRGRFLAPEKLAATTFPIRKRLFLQRKL